MKTFLTFIAAVLVFSLLGCNSAQEKTPCPQQDTPVKINPGSDTGPEADTTIEVMVEYSFTSQARSFRIQSVYLDRDNNRLVIICQAQDTPVASTAPHTAKDFVRDIMAPPMTRQEVFFMGVEEKNKSLSENMARGYTYIDKQEDIPALAAMEKKF